MGICSFWAVGALRDGQIAELAPMAVPAIQAAAARPVGGDGLLSPVAALFPRWIQAGSCRAGSGECVTDSRRGAPSRAGARCPELADTDGFPSCLWRFAS